MSEVALFETAGEVVDNDAIEIGELYAKSNSLTAEAVEARLACGQKLIAVKERLAHGQFIKWIEENQGILGFSNSSTARRLMKAARSNCASTHDLTEPELVRLSRQMWGNATGGDGHVHVTANSGNNEWYTPPNILEAARSVLGDFMLDPASSEAANKHVRAAQFFTAADDGLSRDWPVGTIWMNPPYARPLVDKFCERFAKEIQRGSTGIVLVNNATETGWFQGLAGMASALCFLRGRVRYLNDKGEPVNSPLQGQALIYCGPDEHVFYEAMKPLGLVLSTQRPSA